MAQKRQQLAQCRKAAGYSQERLAEVLGVERSTVVRWERGDTTPQPWCRPLLAQVLGISDLMLTRLLLDTVESASTPIVEKRSDEEGDAVHRRDFLKIVTTFPALSFDELQHLAAAMDDARRYLDADVVRYFKRQLTVCAADDGAHGPAHTLPVVLGVVAAIEQHARLVKATVRRELLAVGAQGAEFVGWLYRDAGQPQLAEHWRDRANEWAQEAGDWPMQGYILLKRSQSAWDERDGLRMLTLAQAAHDPAWHLPPLVQAEVAQQEARGLAMTGEPAGSVDAKLDAAWNLLTNATPVPGELGSQYDRPLLTMQTAICYCEAGQPSRAVELYRSQLTDERFSRRDQGYFLSLMAGALAQAADPDNASDAGHEALMAALETNSQRTMQELVRVCELLAPWRSRRAVCDLRDAVLPLG